MDDVLCALCIGAIYSKFPLQMRNGDGHWAGEVRNVAELRQAFADGMACFEPGTAIAVGIYAETYVKGVALCATHSLYVVHRLDLAKL